jgi:pimeloyl-ACP methyl ester carboxylesterase
MSSSPSDPDLNPWWRAALAHPRWPQRVQINGVWINYQTWQSREKAPLLLFAHGYRGHAHWWDWIAPSFADRYHVAAIDFSGMGDSDWRSDYSGAVFQRDLLGLIEHLGARPVTVVGHSFGGTCLMRSCASAPGAIDHAIVVDSFLRLPGDERFPEAKIGRSSPFPDYASARARYRLIPPQPAPAPLLEHIAFHSLRQVPEGWRWKFDTRLPFAPNDIEATTMLGSIRTRTDYVYGARSDLIDRTRAERIAAQLPAGRRLVEVPSARHHLMLDAPLALISTLRALLD